MRATFILAALLALSPDAFAQSRRIEKLLDGPWEFRRDNQVWKLVTVPSVMQSHEGNDWHGVGWYRKRLGKISLRDDQRLLVHVTAAATFAEVYWNGIKVGEHLGGWTAFRFDVSEHIRNADATTDHELTIKVDERVGHNTQGFLPVIQPHFGGLWQSVKLVMVPINSIDDLTAVPPRDAALPTWSPASPSLKDVAITHADGDRIVIRTASRSVTVNGKSLLLNGLPLQIRGVLNWGYYPPTLQPTPSDDMWRADIRRIKERGFNLMKCCLWLPPKRLLEIADEEGILLWIEYPTWHPQFTAERLPELKHEFEEFFTHVRNHPSVILHSLTCETGASADINVIKELTARCKEMIPGAIVCDDSSWIEWNRVTDFYDDHPYGNNHTWIKNLHRLREYTALGVKPLLLGEAIAADTWTPSDAISAFTPRRRPYWFPHHHPANIEWLRKMREAGHAIDEQRLVQDSKRYAMLMRKYQIETFRREVPEGGYVVSVIRDFPLASMGLVDYAGRDKWPAADWAWHAENMLTMTGGGLPGVNFEKDRCFAERCGGVIHTHGWISNTAQPRVEVFHDNENQPFGESDSLIFGCKVRSNLRPIRLTIKAQLKETDQLVVRNSWTVWSICDSVKIPESVIIARRLDEDLLKKLEAGARVLLLPDNGPGSPPLKDHWFLRGGPVVFDHPSLPGLHRDFFVETQHFDLAGQVIPDISYISEIDPILLLWDTHDIREVKTHALAYSTRVGSGRLLVSALRHDGENNPAGEWLKGEFASYLADGPEPRKALSAATIAEIRNKLTEQKLELGDDRVWKFRSDPDNNGLANNWHKTETTTDDWTDIRVNRHWESQGFAKLDGWAWYRLTVTVPNGFEDNDIYLKFTGVDDYYEVYVNGEKAGSGGDIATRTTAFNDIKCHKVTKLVKPGAIATIAVRVHDWYGAGGIFRPVTLTTSPSESRNSFIR